MIKKYIRGNSERGSDVIKELEKLGGVNTYKCDGTANCFYFIDNQNNIQYVGRNMLAVDLLKECFEEIKLPEPFKSQEWVVYTETKVDGCGGCFQIDSDCVYVS